MSTLTSFSALPPFSVYSLLFRSLPIFVSKASHNLGTAHESVVPPFGTFVRNSSNRDFSAIKNYISTSTAFDASAFLMSTNFSFLYMFL